MVRLCERPGCSAPAGVAYGIHSAQLLVWLEAVPDDGELVQTGVVCRRHADAMVVPRGWTLDDRRESRPRLFRVSDGRPTSRAKPIRNARRRRPALDSPEQLSPEQLSLSMAGEITAEPVLDGPLLDDPLLDDEITVGEIRPLSVPDANGIHVVPWRFEFDERDDLGGVLDADGPLLSRAFRGQKRPG